MARRTALQCLLALVGITLSVTHANATTTTCASREEFVVQSRVQYGTMCPNGGSYLNTCASDDVEECLLETANSPGHYRLEHKWVFLNVPAGVQFLKFEGRKDTPDENFQFASCVCDRSVPNACKKCDANFLYTPIASALIPDDEQSITVPIGLTTCFAQEIHIMVVDQTPSGDEDSSKVYIDQLQIVTQRDIIPPSADARTGPGTIVSGS